MKYCAKCGTQMSDETVVCPQCQTPSNNQHSPISNQKTLPKRKTNKTNLLIVINIILNIAVLVTFIASHFIPSLINDSPSSLNNSSNNISSVSNSDKSNSNNYTSTCPEDEYGNHDWSSPTCVNPAQCYKCDAYKDNTLGQHSFWTSSDGFDKCMYCGILYEVYMDSLD